LNEAIPCGPLLIITDVGRASAIVSPRQEEYIAMPEIGFLNSGSKAEFAHLLAAFRDGLKSEGYKVVSSAPKGPKDVRIHAEWANGEYSKLPSKAKSLIDKGVKVLAATGGIGAARAAAKISGEVPILFASGRDTPKPGDPSGNSKALHLAMSKPNVADHNRYKRLRELLGDHANIHQLINKASPVHIEEGNWPKPVEASSVAELKAAFQTAVSNKADALLVSGDPFFNSRRNEIVQLAKKHKIPVCYPWREYVEAGGLMSQGPNLANTYRRLGIWAGMVLGGTKPKDLPDADAGHRELVINLKTAKKLNIPAPRLSKLLLMADVVIH
jgi:putative ABC transport system substrate-binding protein